MYILVYDSALVCAVRSVFEMVGLDYGIYCIAGGRVVYPILLYGRVGLLTMFLTAIGAPLSRRRVTMLSLPQPAALCRAVDPAYNRDIQTNKQTATG